MSSLGDIGRDSNAAASRKVAGTRWTGKPLAALRRAYESGVVKVDDLAASFGTSRGQMMRLAKRDGWKRRSAGRLPPAAHRHWNKYRDTQRFGGRALALEVVAGLGP